MHLDMSVVCVCVCRERRGSASQPSRGTTETDAGIMAHGGWRNRPSEQQTHPPLAGFAL